MKINGFIGILAFVTTAANAQTNDFFNVLHTSGGDFTNATITAMTPATMTVDCDGGGASFPIANLSPALQKRYHYNAEAAQQYLDRINARPAAARVAYSNHVAAVKSAMTDLGPPQRVIVTKVLCASEVEINVDGQISKANIHNLPLEVIQFVEDFNKTAAFVDATKHDSDGERMQFNAPGYPAGSLTPHSSDVLNARRHLEDLSRNPLANCTVTARPSRYFLSGVYRVWEYQPGGVPDAPVVASTPHPINVLPARPRPATPLNAGIPPDVYQDIADSAAGKWPDNYEMQVYEIKKQVTAYKTLHGQ